MEGKMQKVYVVAALKESPTNATGDRFKGPQFDDLVRSIKEKGVLVPIIVREVKGGKFEIVAGHRRVAAAKAAGLETVPGVEMHLSEVQAKEVQIIENLQRQDVHPLDEGEGYRFMAEDLKQDVGEIAKRVGKSEKYVRERLGLTGLSAKVAKAYRAGEIGTTDAIMISKLDDEKMQAKALASGRNGEGLHSFIADMSYEALGGKPWANDAKLAEALGDKPEETLFGKKGTDDPVEYGRMMAAYIEHKIREAAAKKERMVRICTSYGSPEMKGVLAQDQYKVLNSKEDVKAATEVILGIVAEGYHDIGRIYKITTNKADIAGRTAHKRSASEVAKAKMENKKQRDRQEREKKARLDLLKRVKWPLVKEKHVDALLEFAIASKSTMVQMPVARRRGLQAEVRVSNGYKHRDWEAPLRKLAKTMSAREKLGLAVDILWESSYGDKGQKLAQELGK